jgi:hypothetical protein
MRGYRLVKVIAECTLTTLDSLLWDESQPDPTS